MTKLSTDQLAKGRKRFLDGYPEIKRQIDALTQHEADALGVSLDLLRETETMRELSEAARVKGEDSAEFFWSFIAETAEEFSEMVEHRNDAMKRALGI